MSHSCPLGFEVFLVVGIRGKSYRDLLNDFQSVSFQANDFLGIVGQKADFSHSQIVKHLGSHAVVAEIGGIAQLFVGLDGVESLFLKFVSMDFGGESNATAFLPEVEKDPSFSGKMSKGGVELASTVASPGSKNIAGEAFGMNSDRDWFFAIDFAADEGEMFAVVGAYAIEVAVEVAKIGGHFDDLLTGHQTFRAATIFDELRDGAGFELVLFLVVTEIANPSHRAVLVHDFANDSGRR